MIGRIYLMIVLTVFGSILTNAQGEYLDKSTPEGRQEAAIARRDASNRSRNDNSELRKLRNDGRRIFRASKPKMSKQDRQMISILPEDKSRYSNFLKSADSGLVRLHDLSICDEKSKFVVKVNCTWSVLGNAGAFSFRREKYSHFRYSDILFKGATFDIEGMGLLAFVTDLGDVPIDGLTLQSDGIKPMADFRFDSNADLLKIQIANAKRGFVIGDYSYTNQVPMKLNTTYAIRSIAYKAKWDKQERKLNRRRYGKNKYRDVVAIFRVIRKHEDSSVTVLWRKLQHNKVPKIKD